MTDIVVTVPIGFTHPAGPGLKGLGAWVAEGDAAGEEWTGTEWGFTCCDVRPNIEPGDRVYVVCEDRIRGYAPLIRMEFEPGRYGMGHITLIRGGGAVAVTIPEKVRGFRGWKYPWWKRSEEVPFPDWQTADRRHKLRQVASGQMELFQ